MAHRPGISMDRLMGAAAVACASCRRLKMRCIGADSPPCARCLKRNRECVVQLPNRQQHHLSSRSKAPSQQPLLPSPSPFDQSTPSPRNSSSFALPAQQQTTAHSPDESSQHPSMGLQMDSPPNQTNMPSIFSLSPIDIAMADNPEIPHPSSGPLASHDLLEPTQVSYSTVLDLVEFFLSKMMFYTPVLSLENLSSPSSLATNRQPLAYAMAFIASTHTPGYSSTRRALFPHMSKLLKESKNVRNATLEENWTQLQALAVLYAYPKVTTEAGQDRGKQMSPWDVKSAIETCAMQVSLHKSVEDLKSLVKSDQQSILSSLPYRRTFFWLWLFIKSHHHSVMTKTPPTMHYDSTITSTLDLILELNPPPGVWRVLAEVALIHTWEQAACFDKSLTEWWCVPPNTRDVGTLQALLENAENLLQEWRSLWLRPTGPARTPTPEDSGDQGPSMTFARSITAFMDILTRFNIVSFAAPIVAHQLVSKTGFATFPSTTMRSPDLAAFLSCVLTSAEAASKCCDIILNLKPTAREDLRYMPDYGFTMLALCCLHVVYAYNMCSDNLTLRGYLAKAAQVALLMTDLCVGCNTCPKIYGDYVLLQLRKANKSTVCSPANLNDARVMSDFQQPSALSGGEDAYSWPQFGSVTSPNCNSLDYLLGIGPSATNWPEVRLTSDFALPINSEMIDAFNTYPVPQTDA